MSHKSHFRTEAPRGTVTMAVREKFIERMSDELTELHGRLSGMGPWITRLSNIDVDNIEASLERLSQEASRVGEEAKAKMLKRMATDFHLLNVVGYAVDLDKDSMDRTPEENKAWERRVEHCYSLVTTLEAVLLVMDSFVRRNRGRILEALKRNEESDL